MEREKRRGSRMGTRKWRRRRRRRRERRGARGGGGKGVEEEEGEEGEEEVQARIKARMINSAQLWRLRGKDKTCDSEDQKTRRKRRRWRRRS